MSSVISGEPVRCSCLCMSMQTQTAVKACLPGQGKVIVGYLSSARYIRVACRLQEQRPEVRYPGPQRCLETVCAKDSRHVCL